MEVVDSLSFILNIHTLVDLNIRNKNQSIPGGSRRISSPCHCPPRCRLRFGGDWTRRGGGRRVEVYWKEKNPVGGLTIVVAVVEAVVDGVDGGGSNRSLCIVI